MCLVAFQKIFRKIFSDVWKRRRKRQTQEKYHQRSRSEIAISPARSRDQRRELVTARSRDRRGAISRMTRRELARNLAIDGSQACDCAISRSTCRELATADLAIDASQDRAVDCDLGRRRDRDQLRDLATSIAIFAAIVGLEIGAAWSSESAGDRRTDCSVSSPLSRARALSLSLSFSGNA